MAKAAEKTEKPNKSEKKEDQFYDDKALDASDALEPKIVIDPFLPKIITGEDEFDIELKEIDDAIVKRAKFLELEADFEGDPGIYYNDAGDWVRLDENLLFNSRSTEQLLPTDSNQHMSIDHLPGVEMIIDAMCSVLLCPVNLKAKEQLVIDKSSLLGAPVRHIFRKAPHFGLDIGKAYTIDHGRSVYAKCKAKIYPVVLGGLVYEFSQGSFSHLFALKKGDYKMIVKLDYGHVNSHSSSNILVNARTPLAFMEKVNYFVPARNDYDAPFITKDPCSGKKIPLKNSGAPHVEIQFYGCYFNEVLTRKLHPMIQESVRAYYHQIHPEYDPDKYEMNGYTPPETHRLAFKYFDRMIDSLPQLAKDEAKYAFGLNLKVMKALLPKDTIYLY